MRVMVVVMVQSQHELLKVSDDLLRVNSENSMQLIGIDDAQIFSPQPHGDTGSQIHCSSFAVSVPCVPVVKYRATASRKTRMPSTK